MLVSVSEIQYHILLVSDDIIRAVKWLFYQSML